MHLIVLCPVCLSLLSLILRFGVCPRLACTCARYVNAFAEKKSFDADRLLRCSWEDLNPSEEDLVREPLLRELCLWPSPSSSASPAAAPPPRAPSSSADTGAGGGAAEPSRAGGDGAGGVEESKGEEGLVLAETKDDGGGARAAVGLASAKKGGGIAARFEVLQLLNRKLRDALPYLDLTQVGCGVLVLGPWQQTGSSVRVCVCVCACVRCRLLHSSLLLAMLVLVLVLICLAARVRRVRRGDSWGSVCGQFLRRELLVSAFTRYCRSSLVW